MNINKLRHQVTIEKVTGSTNDGGGNRLPAWGAVATTWAEVRPLQGNEVVIAEQAGQTTTHIVTMRYRTDINDDMRLNYNGRILTIQTVINKQEKNEALEIRCQEG